jgi:GLPGLI family protein
MKKIVLLFAFISINFFSNAQSKKLNEGIAEFAVSYPSLSVQMKQMESSLPQNMTIYFKNNQNRIEMNTPMGSTCIISDNTKKEISVLMDMMSQKIAIKQTQSEIIKKEAELKKSGKMPVFKIVESKETKEIAGYKCKKAIVEYILEGKKEQMTCYYTDLLPQINTGTDNLALNEIKGFLMEYNINQSGIQMKIVATEIKPEKIDDKLFSIPSDYKIMTQDEISELMKVGVKSKDGK